MVLVARSGHPTVGRRITKAQLEGLRHIEVQVAQGRGSRPLAGRYAELGVVRNIAVVVPTFTAAAAVAAGTDLVASLPDSLMKVLGPRLALRRVATPLGPITNTINLLWHERTDQDPALRAFRSLLIEAVRS